MILDGGGSGGSLTNMVPDFNPSTFRELLAIAIVRHDLPFQFVEYEGIKRCFTYLNHEVNLVKRNTIKSDIKNMFGIEKLKIKDLLSCTPEKMESQLKEICGAIMMEKMDDEQENHTGNGSGVGESESQVA
ncbi:unnamed protein product [Lactuca virosa]|uniref:Uncharacterized protein n=1 Tax=Lactuca virosa TaxID=75947 RepID=A0AAU9PAA9_9ASTR|nr:unnamed protein product [Lactuca virosa]